MLEQTFESKFEGILPEVVFEETEVLKLQTDHGLYSINPFDFPVDREWFMENVGKRIRIKYKITAGIEIIDENPANNAMNSDQNSTA